MQYYDSESLQKCSKLLDYFEKGISDEEKNISHCLLFWGPDISLQCNLALEIARLLNCSDDKSINCGCLNCKWIKEQSHPAVKIYTRLDFKEAASSKDVEDSTKGKKNITVEQAKSIISELSITSDYHRVYIFCDRDEEGNLLPLNRLNFPEATSNALLKTFEEPPQNTTFIFLTKNTSDIISTVVSRAQSFFIPSPPKNSQDFSLVENLMQNYWTIQPEQVLEFQNSMLNLMEENNPKEVLSCIQNYMAAIMTSNTENKLFFHKQLENIKYVEDAKQQLSLTPAMNLQNVIENLCYKLIL